MTCIVHMSHAPTAEHKIELQLADRAMVVHHCCYEKLQPHTDTTAGKLAFLGRQMLTAKYIDCMKTCACHVMMMMMSSIL